MRIGITQFDRLISYTYCQHYPNGINSRIALEVKRFTHTFWCGPKVQKELSEVQQD